MFIGRIHLLHVKIEVIGFHDLQCFAMRLKAKTQVQANALLFADERGRGKSERGRVARPGGAA